MCHCEGFAFQVDCFDLSLLFNFIAIVLERE